VVSPPRTLKNKEFQMSQVTSDQIRQHAAEKYVVPARKAHLGEFEIVAGDLHRDLRLQNRVPLVCAALRSKKFLTENSLVLVDQSGPPSGMSTTVRFKYRFRQQPDQKESSEAPLDKSIYHKIRELYGVAGELYRSLGGGKQVLGKEREGSFGNATGSDPSEPRPG
jgi:hypothetical protein